MVSQGAPMWGSNASRGAEGPWDTAPGREEEVGPKEEQLQNDDPLEEP